MPSSKDRKKERERDKTSKSSSKRDSASSDKEKKKKSSSKDKSRSPSRSRKRSEGDDWVGETSEAPAQQHTSRAPPLPELDQKASLDFEAGLLFQRFARNGGVDAKSFQRMWRERDSARAGKQTWQEQSNTYGVGNGEIEADRVFEFGQLFQKFDTDGDGRLGRAEFERMIGEMLQELGQANKDRENIHPVDIHEGRKLGGEGTNTDSVGKRKNSGRSQETFTEPGINTSTFPGAPVPVSAIAHPPPPLLGGGGITHYDETSGVPLRRDVLASQKALGHTVVPLNKAYDRRLSRLQTLLSSRLMPVREQLLQLRRRYHTRAEEVKAAKVAIERETTADSEAILERLRSAESLKQAALAQGVKSISAELEGVERIANQVSRLAAPASTTSLAFSHARYPHDSESTEKMIELIQSYPELCGSIDGVASKPFDNTIDVRVDDLPHETAERLEVLRRADRYERALGVKDHMLWTVIQESHELEDRCHQERDLGQEFAQEAQEWVALAGRLSNEVKALKKEAEQTKRLREENAVLTREKRDLLRRLEAFEGSRLTNDG